MSNERNRMLVWVAVGLTCGACICSVAAKDSDEDRYDEDREHRPRLLLIVQASLAPTAARLLNGTSSRFTAMLLEGHHARDVTSRVRHWTSSNPSAATIDLGGRVTARGPGTTTISAVLEEEQRGSTQLSVTAALAPVFLVPPASTLVGAAITPAVQVRLTDDLGDPLAGFAVTLSLGTNAADGGGVLKNARGTLSGALTRKTDVNGVAEFPGLKIDWLGSGYTLQATVPMPTMILSAASPRFNELRVGDACLGPIAACSSGCANQTGDGLNDAWKIAGGIDYNGDARIDAQHDLQLPDAHLNQPDIYVQYDWMDWSLPGNACNADADCAANGSGHIDETCSGPQVLPTSAGSCRFACTATSECTARGPGHLTEQCVANSCLHTHDPDVIAPGALQAVVESFAAHGIHLHLVRGHALPHSLVTSFRQASSMSTACEGADPGRGVGIGKYAVSLYDLKAVSALDPLKIAYHYSVFSHYSGCDTKEHCLCPSATNPDGSPKIRPDFGESGLAEVSGNDFIVSLGSRFSDLKHEPGTFDVGSTFMHELGHNLGLRHGGGIDTPCETDGAACPGGGFCTSTPVGKYCLGGDDTNSKPNYLSVMNYRYQFTGIQSASAIGSVSPTSSRLDYSTQTLPVGGNTPGYLDQSAVPDRPAVGDPGQGLNEPAGLGSGTADIFTYTNGRELGIPSFAATDGPVDWSGNGDLLEQHVQADTNCGPPGFADHPCTQPYLQYPKLRGNADWDLAGKNNFTYKFQCTPYGGPTGDGASSSQRVIQHEMSAKTAMQAHVALPIRPVKIEITPQTISPGSAGEFSVTLLGSADLDVAQVDPSSLHFHGATPVRVETRDVNGDGRLDLVLFFDQGRVKLHPQANKAHLTGWLKSSQAFVGESRIGIWAPRR